MSKVCAQHASVVSKSPVAWLHARARQGDPNSASSDTPWQYTGGCAYRKQGAVSQIA